MGQAPVRLYDAACNKSWTELDKLLDFANKTSLNFDGYRHVDRGKLDNRNVLHLAIEYRAPLNLISKILAVGVPKGLNIDAYNRQRETALQSALRYSAGPEVVKLLLDYGASFITSLIGALGHNDKARAREFAITILEHPRAKEVDALHLLSCAVKLQVPRDWISRYLKKDPTLLNARDSEGRTLLLIACESKGNPKESLEVINLLLDNGADIHARTTSEEWTPLHVAAQNGASLYIVQLLLERGADLEALDVKGKTPLHLAMKANEPHLFSILETKSVLTALPVEN